MLNLLEPNANFIFKEIFGNGTNPKIVKSFINTICNLEGNKQIRDLFFIETKPVDEKEGIDKYLRIYYVTYNHDDERIDIDIRRIVDYIAGNEPASNMLVADTNIFNSGTPIMEKLINIDLTDGCYLKNDSYFYNFEFNFPKFLANTVISERLLGYSIELDMFEGYEIEKVRGSEEVHLWAEFFSNPNSISLKKNSYKVPHLDDALELLEKISTDPDNNKKYNEWKSLFNR